MLGDRSGAGGLELGPVRTLARHPANRRVAFPPMSEPQLTPMMQQYRQMKAEVPSDALLLFRLGDFYEMFFDDAKAGAQILNVALTQRNGVPMCGVPYHAATGYIARLIAAGRRVAVCDQMEAARPGQVVRREITQVLSPGSVVESDLLDGARPNFLAAVVQGHHGWGFAFLDTTTGDFRATELRTSEALEDELGRVRPAEIVLPDDAPSRLGFDVPPRATVNRHEGWAFQQEAAFFTLRDHFGTQSLDGFGCAGLKAGICAAGGLLHHVATTLRRPVGHVRSLRVFHDGEFMILDEPTRRTLELVEPSRPAPPGQRHTLLAVLDHTVTPLGARRLRDWVLRPLRHLEPLRERQLGLHRLLDDDFPLAEFRDALGAVRDIERALGRLAQGSGNGRDLLALRASLEAVPGLRAFLAEPRVPLLERTVAALRDLPEVVDLIRRAIDPECPPVLREGGVIADGFDAGLDEMRAASRDGKAWIAALQEQEQRRTGIKSLKVGFNSVFGYYIEITKSNLGSVPPEYHRKQTTTGGERFVTPELKEMEGRILGADERARAREAELFGEVRARVLVHTAAIQETAGAIAALDALASMAEAARLHGYVRPELIDEPRLEIEEGRHPVLEQLPLEERFVPNDTRLDGATARLVILTGPNMAGKSTYLRQVALLVLLAHLGSYVPAKRARIGLMDRIFTRVGASDDLSRGQSTFMVEMNETSNILHHATDRSLVVLDEIGRGTSTFDGLSIAWSVAEHLHNEVRALTLFATHYHETTSLAAGLKAVRLMNVAVREWSDQVVFLRKIVEGAADRSYGIQVARLAGLPKPVLDRARDLLRKFEDGQIVRDRATAKAPKAKKKAAKKKKPLPRVEMDLFLPPE